MRGLASFARSTAPSNGMDAQRSTGVLLSSPAAAQRCAEGAGLDSGAAVEAQSAMPSIALPCSVSTAHSYPPTPAASTAPQLQPRISTSLTDVTLATIIDRIEHGHHVFRAYFKHAFLKRHEKFSTFLRNELVSNNLADFRLKKGLDHLEAVRERFQTITARFAGYQAQWLNVHVDFPLLQRLALPITVGAVRYPGLKIHDTRIIRLLEVLLHGGSHLGGWTAKHIHHAVTTSFYLSESAYGLNQLRYDLRKLKGHGLLQRDGSRYAYRLTPKRGPRGAALSVLPQTALRSAGQQLLPSPTRPPPSPGQQARSRLPPRRQGDTADRRPASRVATSRVCSTLLVNDSPG